MIPTLHIICSRKMGGAEGFYARFVNALHVTDWKPESLLRKGSHIAQELLPGVSCNFARMWSGWDQFSVQGVNRVVNRSECQVVQTYMGRATQLVRLSRGNKIHVARLGGYYDVKKFRHAHFWVTITPRLRAYLIGHGYPANKVFCIGNFVESPKVPLGEVQNSVLKDSWVILGLGRMVPVKGFEYLISAVSRMPKTIRGKNVQLVLVGDGPSKKNLQLLARNFGVQDQVHWMGWQSSVSSYYRQADLVVFPSLKMEGMGNVILEAWSHGKPLIATESFGALDLCRHRQTGWMVPCENSHFLAVAIETLLRDDDLRKDISEAGFREVTGRFSQETVLAQYQELYSRLTGAGTSHLPIDVKRHYPPRLSGDIEAGF